MQAVPATSCRRQMHLACQRAGWRWRAPGLKVHSSRASLVAGRAVGSSEPSLPSTQQPSVQRLASLFYQVQHPAACNRPYSAAVEDFVKSAVEAYECGYNEADLATQFSALVADEEAGAGAGGQAGSGSTGQAAAASAAGTGTGAGTGSLPSQQRAVLKALTEEFMSCVCLVWVTLLLSKGGRRWARSPAVTEPTLALWRGFVTLICTAWFEKRMAWYPLDRLQLELSAVQPVAPPTDVVAERARLVFTVLEVMHPQFPTI